MTVGDVLRRATQYLGAKGVESPRLDAELLLAKALDRSRLELYMEHGRELDRDELITYRALIARRGRREPLAYILGEWGFRRLTVRVDRRALVPRPETEIVVERCLELIAEIAEPEVLDVGTGSGAIALALADERAAARICAIDSSGEALELARENVEAAGLGDRIRLVEHDLYSGFGSEGDFDLVVSNPPYVAPEEVETLQPEVRDWEPRAALVARDAHEAVARAAREALRSGGWLVLETGDEQAARVAEVLEALGYGEVGVTPDLTGRDRVVEGRSPQRT